MYQVEMFERFESKGWKYLNHGLYSSVYLKPDSDWIIKLGRNDGTRTYLEWCMLRTKAGKRMKGMPELDWLVPIGEDKYLCAMRRYYDAQNWFVMHEKPEYIRDLAYAASEETGIWATDLHPGNIMFSKPRGKVGDLILTDPASGRYIPLGTEGASNDFELAIQ